MELIKIIEHLKNSNPYPVDVFPEPIESDWKEIGKFLHEHGKNGDRIFAKWGRMVWNNCVNQFEELTKDE
jgi:hypothetical protein